MSEKSETARGPWPKKATAPAPSHECPALRSAAALRSMAEGLLTALPTPSLTERLPSVCAGEFAGLHTREHGVERFDDAIHLLVSDDRGRLEAESMGVEEGAANDDSLAEEPG